MKLIATEMGRILQLIVMEEIKPISDIYMPTLYERLIERYAFTVKPPNYVEAVANGAKFNAGRLNTPTKTIGIREIGIYNDGIIVEAGNTDDAEQVLGDVILWATNTFGLRPRQTLIAPRFTSMVTVEFEDAIENGLGKLIDIATLVSSTFNRSYGMSINAELKRLSLNADPMTLPPLLFTEFFIERRLQRPYSENRYQSGGPLRTEDHIALLQEIENLFLNLQST